MSKEFCMECGHLLTKHCIQCSFCGWMQHTDLQKDIMANYNKGNEFLYGYSPPDHLSFDPVAML